MGARVHKQKCSTNPKWAEDRELVRARCGQLKPQETVDKLKPQPNGSLLGPQSKCSDLGRLEGEQELLNCPAPK